MDFRLANTSSSAKRLIRIPLPRILLSEAPTGHLGHSALVDSYRIVDSQLCLQLFRWPFFATLLFWRWCLVFRLRSFSRAAPVPFRRFGPVPPLLSPKQALTRPTPPIRSTKTG